MANRAFIRFRDITIPNYAEVSNVYARFTSYSDRSDTPVNLRCAFVNEDNPDAPTSYAELQAFSLTDWVSWNILENWTDGIEYDTPDLTDILQSVIERSGWSSGNSVILIIEDVSSSGQRGFSSVQFNSGNERATLFADYLAREGSGDWISGTIIRENTVSSSNYPNRVIVRNSSGNLYSVYPRTIDGVIQICIAVSTDGGGSWIETRISSGSYNKYFPQLAIDSSNYFHIVWVEHQYYNGQHIQYCKWISGSPAIENITSLYYTQYSINICVDGNDYVHLLWAQKDTSLAKVQIMWKRYTTSWQSTVALTSETANQYNCFMAIDSNNYVHAVWGGMPSGTSVVQIRYRRYTSSWESITNLTSSGQHQQYPSVAVDSNNYVHVSWMGYENEIRYRRFAGSWGTETLLCTQVVIANATNIAVDGNDCVYIIWGGKITSGSLYYQLSYIKYDASWGVVTTITADGTGYNSLPVLMWSIHPTIDSLHVCRPLTGFALQWRLSGGTVPYTVTLKYYGSDDLTWET